MCFHHFLIDNSISPLLYYLDGSTSPLPSSKLSPSFQSDVLHHAAVRWYEFALFLGISPERLDVIRSDHRRQALTCCRKALQQWLNEENGTGGQKREECVVLEAVHKACGPVAVEKIKTGSGLLRHESPHLEGQLESTPTLAALLEHVVPVVAHEWRAMADFLSVSGEKQRVIEATEQGEVVVICRELLNQWLQHVIGTGDLPRTWHAVLKAVADAAGKGVAERIQPLVCPETI